MIISINIDEDCEYCKRALKYLKKLYKRNKNVYIRFLKPFSSGKTINPILLIPDYNSEGYLTHFHLEIDERG